MISLNVEHVGKHGVLIGVGLGFIGFGLVLGFVLVVVLRWAKISLARFLYRVPCWVCVHDRTYADRKRLSEVSSLHTKDQQRRLEKVGDLFQQSKSNFWSGSLVCLERTHAKLGLRVNRLPTFSWLLASVASFLAPCCFTETLLAGWDVWAGIWPKRKLVGSRWTSCQLFSGKIKIKSRVSSMQRWFRYVYLFQQQLGSADWPSGGTIEHLQLSTLIFSLAFLTVLKLYAIKLLNSSKVASIF